MSKVADIATFASFARSCKQANPNLNLTPNPNPRSCEQEATQLVTDLGNNDDTNATDATASFVFSKGGSYKVCYKLKVITVIAAFTCRLGWPAHHAPSYDHDFDIHDQDYDPYLDIHDQD